MWIMPSKILCKADVSVWVAVHWLVVPLADDLVAGCLSFWCGFFFPAWSFSVRPPPPAAAVAAAATLRSARLIINRHWEKVMAGSPGVTVPMGTLINILFPLVCPLARSCWGGLLSLWHMRMEADECCDVTAASLHSSRRFAGGCCSRSWLVMYMHPDSVTPSSAM